ncbi:hypothetical protein CEUSTIGMA_g1984.t1 [Chlamydomonas eustigma]|uniref:RAMA domain-containing protein n=1 Tax=Chlamydomonas eustigma TaxID=1157962 RepID=A0A250WUR1_9CHLO|nr:hypothetical protein CEUSTIGMA_g1984.t1 [Chlamydomonas eustigma]|eukprot:GAX74535.1 hypothetical protein CEUSTIGMA_g1984.t1 [Chlamydomonas eustigma]
MLLVSNLLLSDETPCKDRFQPSAPFTNAAQKVGITEPEQELLHDHIHNSEAFRDMSESGTDTDEEGMLIKQAAAHLQQHSSHDHFCTSQFPHEDHPSVTSPTGNIKEPLIFNEKDAQPSISWTALDSVNSNHSIHIKHSDMDEVLQSETRSEFSAVQQQQQHIGMSPQPSPSPHTTSSTSSEVQLFTAAQKSGEEEFLLGQSNESKLAKRVKDTDLVQLSDAILTSRDECLIPVSTTSGQLSDTALLLASSRPRRKLPARPPGTITLKTLVHGGVLQPGNKVLCVLYKGGATWADLTQEGQILFNGITFESPSSFSVYVKRLQNPTRKADDGWKAIKYDGRFLEEYKEIYLKTLAAGSRKDTRFGKNHEESALRSVSTPYTRSASVAVVNASVSAHDASILCPHQMRLDQNPSGRKRPRASVICGGDVAVTDEPFNDTYKQEHSSWLGQHPEVNVLEGLGAEPPIACPPPIVCPPPIACPPSNRRDELLVLRLDSSKSNEQGSLLDELANPNVLPASCLPGIEPTASVAGAPVHDDITASPCMDVKSFGDKKLHEARHRMENSIPSDLTLVVQPLILEPLSHPQPWPVLGNDCRVVAAELLPSHHATNAFTGSTFSGCTVSASSEIMGMEHSAEMHKPASKCSLLKTKRCARASRPQLRRGRDFLSDVHAPSLHYQAEQEVLLPIQPLTLHPPCGESELQHLQFQNALKLMEWDSSLFLRADQTASYFQSGLSVRSVEEGGASVVDGSRLIQTHAGKQAKSARCSDRLAVDEEDVTQQHNCGVRLDSQSFTLHVSTSALVEMDLHAHLSSQPVHGLLGGVWDTALNCMFIEAAVMVREQDAINNGARWHWQVALPGLLSSPCNQHCTAAAAGAAASCDGDYPASSQEMNLQTRIEGGHYSCTTDALLQQAVAACGMEPRDMGRAMCELDRRGLVCVGRYTSKPSTAAAACFERGDIQGKEVLNSLTDVLEPSSYCEKDSMLSLDVNSAISDSCFPPVPCISPEGYTCSKEGSLSLQQPASGSGPHKMCGVSLSDLKIQSCFQKQMRRCYNTASDQPFVAAVIVPYLPIDSAGHSSSFSWFEVSDMETQLRMDDQINASLQESTSPCIYPPMDHAPLHARIISPHRKTPCCMSYKEASKPTGNDIQNTTTANLEQGNLVSVLQARVTALASEYGGRLGAQEFLSEPAWDAKTFHSSDVNTSKVQNENQNISLSPGALNPKPSSPSVQIPLPSRLQHVVASASVLLPPECREPFADMLLAALVTGLQLLEAPVATSSHPSALATEPELSHVLMNPISTQTPVSPVSDVGVDDLQNSTKETLMSHQLINCNESLAEGSDDPSLLNFVCEGSGLRATTTAAPSGGNSLLLLPSLSSPDKGMQHSLPSASPTACFDACFIPLMPALVTDMPLFSPLVEMKDGVQSRDIDAEHDVFMSLL